MSSVKVRTNNVQRDLLYWDDLSKEQIKTAKEEGLPRDGSFFTYKGNLYSMDQFLSLRNSVHCPWGQDVFPGWDGHLAYGLSAGIVVKYGTDECGDEDPGRIIIGTYVDYSQR